MGLHCIAISNRVITKKIHYKILREITGAQQFIRHNILHASLKISTVDQTIQVLCYQIRIQTPHIPQSPLDPSQYCLENMQAAVEHPSDLV